MPKISQNKKIALSAVAIFIVSFSIMLFFLGDNPGGLNSAETNVLNSGGHGEQSESNDSVVKYSEELVSLALKAEEPIFVVSAEGIFERANSNFCNILDFECDKLKGKKLFDFISKDDIADLVSAHSELILYGKNMDGIGPIKFTNKKSERLLLLSAKPLGDDKGKVSHIIFAAKDLTEIIKNFRKVDKEKTEEQREWFERLYPKIEESDDQDTKILVDKISFARKR